METGNKICENMEDGPRESLGALKSEMPEGEMTTSEIVKTVIDEFKTYIFAWVSGIIMLIGFIYGIYAANHYTIKTIETVGKYAPKEEIVETINYPIMWIIWGGTLLLALSFFAVYCILRNQDKMIEALNKNHK